jgi:uncharacterized protein
MTDRLGGWIQLVSGKPFWPLDPRPEEIEISDIAWALSNLCRYGGHCRRFYSVGEHSVLVSRLVPSEYALWGLLHDATEAYLVDLPKPIKDYMPTYRTAEYQLANCIAIRFDLSWPMPEPVKYADQQIRFAERAALLTPSELEWNVSGEPPDVTVNAWPPVVANSAFHQRFRELTQK